MASPDALAWIRFEFHHARTSPPSGFTPLHSTLEFGLPDCTPPAPGTPSSLLPPSHALSAAKTRVIILGTRSAAISQAALPHHSARPRHATPRQLCAQRRCPCLSLLKTSIHSPRHSSPPRTLSQPLNKGKPLRLQNTSTTAPN